MHSLNPETITNYVQQHGFFPVWDGQFAKGPDPDLHGADIKTDGKLRQRIWLKIHDGMTIPTELLTRVAFREQMDRRFRYMQEFYGALALDNSRPEDQRRLACYILFGWGQFQTFRDLVEREYDTHLRILDQERWDRRSFSMKEALWLRDQHAPKNDMPQLLAAREWGDKLLRHQGPIEAYLLELRNAALDPSVGPVRLVLQDAYHMLQDVMANIARSQRSASSVQPAAASADGNLREYIIKAADLAPIDDEEPDGKQLLVLDVVDKITGERSMVYCRGYLAEPGNGNMRRMVGATARFPSYADAA